MQQPLLGFLQTARGAGIRISVAEGLDAVRALETIGLHDRAALKDALGLVLAKSRDEKILYDACFELYFSREGFFRSDAGTGDGSAGDPNGTDFSEMRHPQTGTRRDPPEIDRAELALALEAAGRRLGVAGIRFPVQTNMYVLQLMRELGLDRDREDLRAYVRAFVERNLALAAPAESRWRDDNLRTVPLWNLDRRDVERMRVVVRALAKRLATRYGRDRRHRRRGHLDVRRTLRRNTAHDGVPFTTVWKRRKLEKPRVLALCDVSGSVAPVAQFLLLFLHSLAAAVSDIRSFAFSSHLVDVSELMEDEPVETAIAEVVQRIGFRSTDYGRSLADFAAGWLDRVDGRTSVIIMGDARGNYADPRTDLMKKLYERAKHVIWLNPEPRTSWGTGDSDMLRYLPYCHIARECRTLRDLERAITTLLTRGA